MARQGKFYRTFNTDNGWHSRGYLPHFNSDAVSQIISIRLFDAVPSGCIYRWKKELIALPEKQKSTLLRNRVDHYADRGHGCCFLKRPEFAAIAENALLFYDQRRFTLHAWVIMPNHVHFIFTPEPGCSTKDIIRNFKQYTARQINKSLDRAGGVWFPEHFDRFVRNRKHYDSAVSYIMQNPVTAGFCERPDEWRFSSAYRHEENYHGRAPRCKNDEYQTK